MELRDYQVKQLRFLKNNTSSNGTFTKGNISLQSPTGSGKSIVMLEYVRWYLNRFPGKKIFISTGFNELVWQFYDTAVSMGINAEVLIGRSHAVCARRDTTHIRRAFVRDAPESSLCGSDSPCGKCKKEHHPCYYSSLVNDIAESPHGMLVVTNHSSLFVNSVFSKFSIGFVDECQTAGDFYQNSISVNITSGQIERLLRDAEGTNIDPVRLAVTRQQFKAGRLRDSNLIRLANARTKRDNVPLRAFHPGLSESIKKLEAVQDSDPLSYYRHPQKADGRLHGIVVDRFFRYIDFPTTVCLVSATVDSYTKSISEVKGSYRELGCSITDYSKSRLKVYDDYNTDELRSFLSEQTGEHGLFLSTRLDLVSELGLLGKIEGYELVFDRRALVPGKRQILAGSKKLFQGIDIPDIDFVMINRIPFNRYDDAYRHKMAYYDSLGEVSYTFYTLPYTTNQLIQCMGRLWRHPGDVGNIALFDSRAKSTHSGIVKDAVSCREGLKVELV